MHYKNPLRSLKLSKARKLPIIHILIAKTKSIKKFSRHTKETTCLDLPWKNWPWNVLSRWFKVPQVWLRKFRFFWCDWLIDIFDFHSAFLNGELDNEKHIYMQQPLNHLTDDHNHFIVKLHNPYMASRRLERNGMIHWAICLLISVFRSWR